LFFLIELTPFNIPGGDMRKEAFFWFVFGAIVLSLFIFPSDSIYAGSGDGQTSIMTMLYTPRADEVVEPCLLVLPGEESVKVWVFFTDKGLFSADELQSALKTTRNSLTQRAYERRAKARGAEVVDFRDIPVNESYVEQVVANVAVIAHRSKWFNGISAVIRLSNLEKIVSLPFVRRIEKVKVLGTNLDDIRLNQGSPEGTFDIFEYTLNYGASASQLMQVNVPPAHELGFDGSNIIVCMLDVGYKKGHQAFSNIIGEGRLLAEWDFINNDGQTDLEPGDPSAQADHGTMTWSTLGGETSGQLYGPAYNAKFILGKTEDVSSERHIEEDNWAAAAEWADSIGAQVISASLGYRWFDSGQGDYQYSDLDGNTTIVTIAADLAAYNGIAVCTAMGNEGYSGAGSLLAPADGDSVISCGAVDVDGIIASFSSLGPTYDNRTKPEVVARGVNTNCADPYSMNGYTTASGTSLSTPLIGGASAVVLSAHPNWTPMQVREALMQTADKFNNPDNTYGWGLINTTKAIFYNPSGDIVFDFAPLSYAEPFSQAVIWADITCSQGLNPFSVKLYWNNDGSYNYSAISFSHVGDTYFASIPTQSMGDTIYYYIYAEKSNGLSEVYPVGAPIQRFSTVVSDPHFFDNFDNGPYSWKTGGTNDFWGLTATYSHSGHLAFTDSPQGKYRNSSNNWVMLKEPLAFATAQNPQLTFWHRYDLQTNSDYVYVEGSIDGGLNWVQIGNSITGLVSNYTQATYSLAQFAGAYQFLLRFRLSTNASTNRDGWYVDDVSITWNDTGGLCTCDVNMIPDNSPISVPPGGSFGLTGIIGNVSNAAIVTDVRVGVKYLNTFFLLWNFANIPLNPGQFLNAHLNQSVPGYAPQGTYQYIAYCGDYPNNICDSASFPFTVTGTRLDGGADEWTLEGGFGATAQEIPSGIAIYGNSPNPFNAQTNITFDMPISSNINLAIYNLMGQKVATLVDGNMESGYHSINWDAGSFSSGIYFYRLSVGDKVFTKRMTLLK